MKGPFCCTLRIVTREKRGTLGGFTDGLNVVMSGLGLHVLLVLLPQLCACSSHLNATEDGEEQLSNCLKASWLSSQRCPSPALQSGMGMGVQWQQVALSA